jgi:hypothetical protein
MIDAFQTTEEHSLTWDAMDDHHDPVSSGVYYYRLEAAGKILQKKMLLLR